MRSQTWRCTLTATSTVGTCADTYVHVPGPPYCTYGLRVPASRVPLRTKGTGQLAPGGHCCTYAVRVPASGVPYVQSHGALEPPLHQSHGVQVVPRHRRPSYRGDNQRTAAPQVDSLGRAVSPVAGRYAAYHPCMHTVTVTIN